MATQSVPMNDSQGPQGHEFFSLNGRYVIDPDSTRDELINDAGCFFDGIKGILEAVINGLEDEGSDMSANVKKEVPRLLWSAMHQVHMVQNLCAASFQAPEGKRTNGG